MRVFDVNLRKPFYTRGVLEDSLGKATILKLNDAEMPEVLKLLKLDGGETAAGEADPSTLRKGAQALLDEFPLQLVCITMGGSGSLLVTREIFDQHPGIPIQVVDTIGAGDAFTAALTSYYCRVAPLPVLNEAGIAGGPGSPRRPERCLLCQIQKRTRRSSGPSLQRDIIRKTAKDGELVGLCTKGFNGVGLETNPCAFAFEWHCRNEQFPNHEEHPACGGGPRNVRDRQPPLFA